MHPLISRSFLARSEHGTVRSSSPLSSIHDHSDPVHAHSESAILDARDDAAVENLLDSVSASAMPPPAAAAPSSSETSIASGVLLSSDKAAETSRPAEGNRDVMANEDEEFARFVQMTLEGMARAQEGLRGVFDLTRRSLAVQRAAAAAAQRVAGAGEGSTTAAAVVAPGGDHGPASAPN